jgi:hypothetical protein
MTPRTPPKNENYLLRLQASDVAAAMSCLKKAFQRDSDYAHSWYANLAMMSYDSIRADPKVRCSHESALRVGQEGARRFMKLAFDVYIETSRLKPLDSQEDSECKNLLPMNSEPHFSENFTVPTVMNCSKQS